MSDKRTQALVQECRRQEESCLYTSTALYIWQKRARLWKNAFVIFPIILGGVASSSILTGTEASWAKISVAILTLLAGFFPAIYEALGMNMRVTEIAHSAAEFTNLRDRFRQVALVHSHVPFDEFNAAFEQIMDRMDAARTSSPPVPEWCFEQAQSKIAKGDYEFNVDETGND